MREAYQEYICPQALYKNHAKGQHRILYPFNKWMSIKEEYLLCPDCGRKMRRLPEGDCFFILKEKFQSIPKKSAQQPNCAEKKIQKNTETIKNYGTQQIKTKNGCMHLIT